MSMCVERGAMLKSQLRITTRFFLCSCEVTRIIAVRFKPLTYPCLLSRATDRSEKIAAKHNIDRIRLHGPTLAYVLRQHVYPRGGS
jgi:hypothetical protein